MALAPSPVRDTMEVDLDCDGNTDINLELVMGDSVQEAMNWVSFYERDTNVAACGSKIQISPPLIYTAMLFDRGDTLNCIWAFVMAEEGEVLIGGWNSGGASGLFPSEESEK